MGNLTRDPEVRKTGNGSTVAEISLALNRSFTLQSGEKQEETTFVEVVLWNRQAEIAGEYLSKGRGVYVEGRLHLDTWQDRETGKNRQKLRVVGERMQFVGSTPQGEGSKRGEGSRGQPRAVAA